MSFFSFLGARPRVQQQSDLPKRWEKPLYEDDELVMRIHTNCPFPVDDLPFCESALMPRPLCERQEMTSFHRNGFGQVKYEIQWVALFAAGALNWCPRMRVETPHGEWAGAVLFPA